MSEQRDPDAQARADARAAILEALLAYGFRCEPDEHGRLVAQHPNGEVICVQVTAWLGSFPGAM